MKKEDFKHGMRVKCFIKGFEIKDAKISINKEGDIFICQNHFDGFDAENKLGYLYSYWIDTKTKGLQEELTQLEPATELDLVPTKGIKVLVWDGERDIPVERELVYFNTDPFATYPWSTTAGSRWKHAKPITQVPSIEIEVKINGKITKLSDISEETLLKLRNL